MDDIEQLLGEEENKEADKKETKVDGQETSEQKIARLEKENEAIKRAHKTVSEKLKAKETAPKEEVDPNDPLATREGWIKHIDQVAEEKAAKTARQIDIKDALKSFRSEHKEFDTEEGKAKLKSIIEHAKMLGLDKVSDADEALTAMRKAFAAVNYDAVDAEAKRQAEERRKTAADTAQATGAGESTRIDEDKEFTKEERDNAEALGWTPEEYRRSKGVFTTQPNKE